LYQANKQEEGTMSKYQERWGMRVKAQDMPAWATFGWLCNRDGKEVSTATKVEAMRIADNLACNATVTVSANDGALFVVPIARVAFMQPEVMS
jgi:hypothetical protein